MCVYIHNLCICMMQCTYVCQSPSVRNESTYIHLYITYMYLYIYIYIHHTGVCEMNTHLDGACFS